MPTREETVEPDAWLAHAAALRRLAASLIRDEHESEDLVQEAWLRFRDSAGSKPVTWLRTVVRNLVRDRLRERGRRGRTELDAARAERLPSADEIAEGLETAQRVAAEVVRLPEPYRTAIHARYFEDRSPEEIARVSGTPLETVRTRLRRGLEMLRGRMDQAHDGRRNAWAVVLAPLAVRGSTPVGIAATVGAIMSTKLALSAAAILAVAAGLFLVRQRLDTSERPPAIVTREQSSAELVRGSELGLVEGAPTTARTEVGSLATPLAGPVGDSSMTEIHGTVVIEDHLGIQHATESGTLWIVHVHDGEELSFDPVEFERGAWSFHVRADERFMFTKLFTGGRQAMHEESQPRLPGPDSIPIRGKLPPRGRLRVVDAETRVDLTGIEVRCAEGWRANPMWTHPGDDPRSKVVISGGSSPVDLPGRIHRTPYWVHAPGHSWARIDFDHEKGGEETIALSSSSSRVFVKAVGGKLPARARVRLYPVTVGMEDAPESSELPSDWTAAVSVAMREDGTAQIDDLQAGRFVAALETGEIESKVRLGQAPVEVLPGSSATVVVPWNPSLIEFERTHLFGTLTGVPQGVGQEEWSLVLQRKGGGEEVWFRDISGLTPVPGREGEFAWDAGLVRTGTYTAEVRWIRFVESVDATNAGETKVEIRLPPLARVTVEIVDGGTGLPLEPENVDWQFVEGSEHYWIPIQRNPRTGRREFVAVPGETTLRASAVGFEFGEVTRRIENRESLVRLELHRGNGIRIEVRVDSAVLTVGVEFFYVISLLREGDEDGEETRLRDDRVTAVEGTKYVAKPGRYRLEFPELEGFERIEPRVVVVREGEVVDVKVDVRRSR